MPGNLSRSANCVNRGATRSTSNGFSQSSSIIVDAVMINCRGLSTSLNSEAQVKFLHLKGYTFRMAAASVNNGGIGRVAYALQLETMQIDSGSEVLGRWILWF